MADENMGMAAQAAKNWKKAAAKKNVEWMFDGYKIYDNYGDALKNMYMEYGLNMTETLPLEQYLSPTERNETLKSILIEIPVGFTTRFCMSLLEGAFSNPVAEWFVSKHLKSIEAFGDLFDTRNFDIFCPGCFGGDRHLTFQYKAIHALNGQQYGKYPPIPIKIINRKLTFILPLTYVYPVERVNRIL